MALLCFFDCFTTRHQVPKNYPRNPAEVLRIDPNFSLERFAKTTPWKNQDDLTRGLIESIRKAGLK